ncbi:cellulase family glycosylhydrolase [bacterium]|nr:cellulase family glycosylhydrolase [bacterium]
MARLLVVALLLLPVATALAQPYGLHVDEEGRLLKDGKPYRGYGVNWYDVFLKLLADKNWTGYDSGFQQLAAAKVPFVRFIACGFWPKDARLYLDDPTEFFRRLDLIVRSAEQHGVGLIPSLFWHTPTVCDLVGETCDQWGNPQSRTQEYMRRYVRDVVTRYQDSPAIWAWEFANEYNLGANLPNAREHRPAVWPNLGTAVARSEKDEWTYEIIRTVFAPFGQEVRKYDPYRALSSGDSVVRAGAWHNWTEKTWGPDTLEQQIEMTIADNPAPVDLVSVHIYPSALPQLPMAVQAAKRMRKPLFVGEFGAPGPPEKSEAPFRELLKALEDQGVPLAALWTFGGNQKDTYTVTVEGDRAYQLQSLTEANARLQGTP